MIELCYHCPDCHTYLSGWFSPEDQIDQPEECVFCGSKQAFVYFNDVESESNGLPQEIIELLEMTQKALVNQAIDEAEYWEDTTYFDD